MNNYVAIWLEFKIRFLNTTILPKWKGNIIRGSIGNSLKKLFCMNKSLNNCYKCPFNNFCPFGYLYRTYILRPKGFLSKYKFFTKPYTIKPPLTQQRKFNKNDNLTFGIVIFGNAIKFTHQVIHSIQYLGNIGIGKRNKRGKFIIEEICTFNPFKNKKEIIYENGNFLVEKLRKENFIMFEDLNKRINKRFVIEFITPTQIIKNNAFKLPNSFYDIFPFMLRKYTNIIRAYCGIPEIINSSEIKEFVESKITLEEKLEEKVITIKYTKNKKVKVEPFFIGKYLFYSSSSLPKVVKRAINFGTLSNIGKRATYGHGWYKVI